MKKLYVLIVAATLAIACSGGSSKLTLKSNGKDIPFEAKVSAAAMRPDIKETGFVITNYDLDLADKSVRGAKRPSAPGQVMISFAVNVDKADFQNPLSPGEFTDKIAWATIDTDKSSDQVSFKGTDGKIVITEVGAETIKGTIDLKKDNSSITGPFEAKIISRKLGG